MSYLYGLLTSREAAERLGTSENYVCTLARVGKIPALKKHRRWWFTPADIDAHIPQLQRNQITLTELLAELSWLIDGGDDWPTACTRLGTTPDAVYRRCLRAKVPAPSGLVRAASRQRNRSKTKDTK